MDGLRPRVIAYLENLSTGGIVLVRDVVAALGGNSGDAGLQAAPGSVEDVLRGLVAEKVICHFCDDIFYLPDVSGSPGSLDTRSPIDVDRLSEKLWMSDNGDIFGYCSGPYVAARLGFQTSYPRKRDIFTNRYYDHPELADVCSVYLRRPPVLVDSGNHRYLTLLDSLSDMSAFDCDDLPSRFRVVVEQCGLDWLVLAEYAKNCYTDDVRSLIERSRRDG